MIGKMLHSIPAIFFFKKKKVFLGLFVFKTTYLYNMPICK